MLFLPHPPHFFVDHSADTQISLSGADRVKFLQGFCTNDIKLLTPGKGCEAFITSHQGKTIGHVVVGCEEDRLVLNTVPGQAEKLIKHLDRFIITEDVILKNETQEFSKWLLAGGEIENHLQSHGINLPADLFEFKTIQMDGHEAKLQRVPYAGFSFLLTAPRDNADTLAAQLIAWKIPLFESPALLNGMRIDANWPLFGWDITDDNLPQEIGRDKQAISFKKGCYLGQETVARLDALGHVNRILARVKFDPSPDQPEPTIGTELNFADKPVGKITSVGWSPLQKSFVAFALVRVAQAKSGTRLTSECGEAEVI